MQLKMFVIKGKIEETEEIINEWFATNGGYIHNIIITPESDTQYSVMYIFYDITDKYAEIVSAIRGEK